MAGPDHAFRTTCAATRWAIVGLVQSLAIELGPRGVRVNAILPGLVTAADVAALALYLCSPAACEVTGQTIRIGGNVPDEHNDRRQV